MFRGLEAEQLREITSLLLDETRRRLHAQGVELEMEPGGRWTGWPTRATNRPSAPGRCAA
ncbi:hypothetical protein [Nonomuraea salmonea]|uniref:hypothetical protein n=1 Tax=Nonomuraea salmonea TaxID=46181 RepID=UPI003CD07FA2